MSWENELLWLVIEYYCSTYVIYVFITAVTSSIVIVYLLYILGYVPRWCVNVCEWED